MKALALALLLPLAACSGDFFKSPIEIINADPSAPVYDVVLMDESGLVLQRWQTKTTVTRLSDYIMFYDLNSKHVVISSQGTVVVTPVDNLFAN